MKIFKNINNLLSLSLVSSTRIMINVIDNFNVGILIFVSLTLLHCKPNVKKRHSAPPAPNFKDIDFFQERPCKFFVFRCACKHLSFYVNVLHMMVTWQNWHILQKFSNILATYIFSISDYSYLYLLTYLPTFGVCLVLDAILLWSKPAFGFSFIIPIHSRFNS